jgi:toxin YoeB
MRRISFDGPAFDDFNEWQRLNKAIHKRIIELLKDVRRDPFTGIGKPEALKHELRGHWSRRINQEHRLIYRVLENEIVVTSCRDHP